MDPFRDLCEGWGFAPNQTSWDQAVWFWRRLLDEDDDQAKAVVQDMIARLADLAEEARSEWTEAGLDAEAYNHDILDYRQALIASDAIHGFLQVVAQHPLAVYVSAIWGISRVGKRFAGDAGLPGFILGKPKVNSGFLPAYLWRKLIDKKTRVWLEEIPRQGTPEDEHNDAVLKLKRLLEYIKSMRKSNWPTIRQSLNVLGHLETIQRPWKRCRPIDNTDLIRLSQFKQLAYHLSQANEGAKQNASGSLAALFHHQLDCAWRLHLAIRGIDFPLEVGVRLPGKAEPWVSARGIVAFAIRDCALFLARTCQPGMTLEEPSHIWLLRLPDGDKLNPQRDESMTARQRKATSYGREHLHPWRFTFRPERDFVPVEASQWYTKQVPRLLARMAVI